MMKIEIAYLVIEGGKVPYASPALDAQARLRALSALPFQKTREPEAGLFVQPYKKKGDSLPDFMIGFTLGETCVVCVIPWEISEGRSFRWMARHLWDSNDMRSIAKSRQEVPEALTLKDDAQRGAEASYPFVTLSMTWPSGHTRYEYAQQRVRLLAFPAENRISGVSGRRWIAAAVTATALIGGTYYLCRPVIMGNQAQTFHREAER